MTLADPSAPAATAAAPTWFPFQLDLAADRVLMVRKSEADYRAASFLDQRSLAPDAQRSIAEWSDVVAAADPQMRRDVQYIFHIGHVGSTLISRLLGELETVLALREPLILRSFAEALGPLAVPSVEPEEARRQIDALTALLSRTFRPDQRAIVKATSFTSEIADLLVPAGSRALFLYASARRYIEGILAGEASRQELAMLSPGRMDRLRTRCPGLLWDVATMSEAQRAAMSWACEMTSLERSAASLPGGSVAWLDFDAFLADPATHLARLAGFFGHAADPAQVAAICAGPLMRRYSKALEYEYSPQLRQDLLAEARGRHGPAIDAAIAWLKEEGQSCPTIARALDRAG